MYGIGGGVAVAGTTVLASTGVPVAWPFVLGAALVVAGLVLLRVSRNRKEARRG